MVIKPIIQYTLFVILCCIVIPATAQHRKLIWSDEFNIDGLPDTTKWTYEEGFIRNIEKQYYTVGRKENARVENGYLIIEARKEDYPNRNYDASRVNWKYRDSIAEYTSASLTTLYKRSFKYGRIEVRAKIPHGLGVWPAIWMLGENRTTLGWPWCSEIDIMEFVGHDSTHIHSSAHYPLDTSGETTSYGGEIEVQQPYNDFHTYAIEWNNKEIRYFYDDSCYHHFPIAKARFQKRSPFTKPFYLIVNLALGGSWGRALNDAILPQRFVIDYIRVYQ